MERNQRNKFEEPGVSLEVNEVTREIVVVRKKAVWVGMGKR